LLPLFQAKQAYDSSNLQACCLQDVFTVSNSWT
jgi:hypothetical protein